MSQDGGDAFGRLHQEAKNAKMVGTALMKQVEHLTKVLDTVRENKAELQDKYDNSLKDWVATNNLRRAAETELELAREGLNAKDDRIERLQLIRDSHQARTHNLTGLIQRQSDEIEDLQKRVLNLKDYNQGWMTKAQVEEHVEAIEAERDKYLAALHARVEENLKYETEFGKLECKIDQLNSSRDRWISAHEHETAENRELRKQIKASSHLLTDVEHTDLENLVVEAQAAADTTIENIREIEEMLNEVRTRER